MKRLVKTYRMRSGRIPRAGASVSMELGRTPSPYLAAFTSMEALRSPCSWHFTEPYLYRCDQLFTPISKTSTLTGDVGVEAGLKIPSF